MNTTHQSKLSQYVVNELKVINFFQKVIDLSKFLIHNLNSTGH